MNYTTGDMKMKITSEKEVTIDDVVAEANVIYKKMKASKIKFGDTSGKVQTFMDEIRKQHPQFCTSYPIVMRYICEMQEYDSKVFAFWLKKIRGNPMNSEGEYLDAQAAYVTSLFRRKNPKASRTHVANVRANVRAMLQAEHDVFKQNAQAYEKEVIAEEDMLRDRNADEMRAFAKLAGAEGLAKAETIRVETEIPCGDAIDIDKLISAHTELRPEDFKPAQLSSDDLLK